ncbi:MAG TPA: hypothetical protein VMF89_31055 [Polyangiales bacterium]|nr:hypothetical protein [Polyangiales bacterium]
MLEALQWFAFVVAVRRARAIGSRAALIVAGIVGYLLLADLLCMLAAPPEGNVFALFRNVFLGPTASPLRAASLLPLPASLIAQPLWIRAIRAGLCWALGSVMLRESSRLNPLLPRAYALDGAALPFIAVGLLDALEAVIVLFAWLLLGEDAVNIPRNGHVGVL